MASSYLDTNSLGLQVAIFPLTIKREGENTIVINKIFVKNFSNSQVLTNINQLNFKLKYNSYFELEDIESLPFISIHDSNYYTNNFIPYDNSVNFEHDLTDFILGVYTEIQTDEQFFIFRTSYDPIGLNYANIGTHLAQLFIEYTSNGISKQHIINLEGSCVSIKSPNANSLDGFELNLIASVHGKQISSIIIK